MKRMIILALCMAVVAAPCIYDLTSQEPSPLASGIAALGRDEVIAFAAD
jgi:hypothetical protein